MVWLDVIYILKNIFEYRDAKVERRRRGGGGNDDGGIGNPKIPPRKSMDKDVEMGSTSNRAGDTPKSSSTARKRRSRKR
ncbi:conserved hypothetical protein [Ricinus communis]|uniref:Uncharacterized protein n=1 Tax=Ricinus communis TaxID=3988 RepID=B9SR31_RICCO|nr:conserved hypothetical protein [Ricinus communis]